MCLPIRSGKPRTPKPKSKKLLAKIGKLAVENGFFARDKAMSPSECKAMINRGRTDLSLTNQCKILKISRSSLYYVPVGVNVETLELMNEIDRVFTKYPFLGSCQLCERTTFGAATSLTCRCGVGSCIWWPSFRGKRNFSNRSPLSMSIFPLGYDSSGFFYDEGKILVGNDPHWVLGGTCL